MTDKNNKTVRVKIAHINDTHSYFEPSSLQLDLSIDDKQLSPFVSAGGFARIATRVRQLREQAKRRNNGFLFLHAGDCFQGTLYFSLFKGDANATMLNALNIDAMALGNHELDMGNAPVAQFAGKIEFPLLAGNWDLSNESSSKKDRLSNNDKVVSFDATKRIANWIEKQVDGERIAIFSLALDKMADISNPDWDTPFVSTIETARQTVQEIRRQGINKIILLSHMGYDADIDLPNHVDGISLIVGGHSHRLQGDFSDLGLVKDDPYGVKVKQSYIVQAGYHALSLGHCDIEFDQSGRVVSFVGKNELLLGRQLFIDASRTAVHSDAGYQQARSYIDAHPNVMVCKKDRSVQELLEDKYSCQVRRLQQHVIANAKYKLRHTRVPDAQGASEIAPLVARSFTYQMRQLGHDVDFAIHNAGGVRNSLNPGDVTVADVAGKLLPFAVPIGVYEIRGKYLPRIIEGAINNALNNGVEGTGDGSYPYTHNLRFVYDGERAIGDRITSIQILTKSGWHDVEPDKHYVGASSAYTMKGKEGYNAILNMQGEGITTSISMADCFVELLKARPEILNEKDNATANKLWHKGC